MGDISVSYWQCFVKDSVHECRGSQVTRISRCDWGCIESRFLEYGTSMGVSSTARVRVCESLRIHY